MSKIIAYLIIVPFIIILMINAITVFEFTLKQRYIKDCIDAVCDKVRITGVMTESDLNNLIQELNKYSDFDKSESITLRKGSYINGTLGSNTAYVLGEKLDRGDAFYISVISSSVSNYSKIVNGGISANDAYNIYYTAKAQCRIE